MDSKLQRSLNVRAPGRTIFEMTVSQSAYKVGLFKILDSVAPKFQLVKIIQTTGVCA